MEHEMSYPHFIAHQAEYVGKKVEFTIKFKADGIEHKTERIVWSKSEFALLKEDSLIEVVKVKILN